MKLCFAVKALNKIRAVALRATKTVLDRIETVARRLWRTHSHHMKTDASYAAAAAIVLGCCFGAVPIKEALAAVLAVVFGIAMSARNSYTRPVYDQGLSRWNQRSEWDTDIDFA